MGVVQKYWGFVKIFFMFLRFRYRQYRLKTNEKTIIKTINGPIMGVKRISIWNDAFYSFEKIPFAKPPIGELRFKAPQPVEPWTEVRDCTKEGPMPKQTNLMTKKIEGCEDCLYLNVYTKNLNPTKPLPVMVWIYGGGFESGGAIKDLYSPDYFMQKDVVIISITYRVGPFGFLSLEDPNLDVPGNAGLKDQVLALKWVKENCANFGGDSENITVFGESAGAASTQYMSITENTKNLFHKVILQSGSALCPWAMVPPRQWALRMCRILGYDGVGHDQEIFEFLKTQKANAILKAESKLLTPEEHKMCIIFPFGPVIEPYKTDQCVIPEHPKLMMRKGWGRDLPMIIGGTSYEGLILYKETKRNSIWVNGLGDCESLVPLELNLPFDDEKCKEYGKRLKEIYFKGEDPHIKKNIHSYLELCSYKFFWHGIDRTIKSRNKHSSNTITYLYRFDVDSPTHNLVRRLMCGPNQRGSCHGDDMNYMFLTAVTPSLEKASMELVATEQMIGCWTRFAETGDPNCDCIEPVEWDSLPKNSLDLNATLKCINFGNNKVSMIDLPEIDKIQAWDSMYIEAEHELY